MGICPVRSRSQQQTYNDILTNYVEISEKLVSVSQEIKEALTSLHIINGRLSTLEEKAQQYENPITIYEKNKYIENENNIYKHDVLKVIPLKPLTKQIKKDTYRSSSKKVTKLQNARDKLKKLKKFVNENVIPNQDRSRRSLGDKMNIEEVSVATKSYSDTKYDLQVVEEQEFEAKPIKILEEITNFDHDKSGFEVEKSLLSETLLPADEEVQQLTNTLPGSNHENLLDGCDLDLKLGIIEETLWFWYKHKLWMDILHL